MTPRETPPADRVPTLTEVIELGPEAPIGSLAASSTLTAPAASIAGERELVQRVFADVQRQVDLLLEHRVRELLGPALARLADALVRETRSELASALREVVSRAVAQEIARHRGR